MQSFKSALILDLDNLYFAVQDKFGKRKILITEYVRVLEERGHILVHKIAYCRKAREKSADFMTMLSYNGFECHFGSPNWAVAMALRAADVVPNVDCLILGSNNPESGRILAWAKERGRMPKCFAVDIPPFFNQFAECVEVDESVLNGIANPT